MRILIISLCTLSFLSTAAQHITTYPDINDKSKWKVYNRKINVDTTIHLNSNQGDGVVWFKDLIFKDGEIELDIKGKDIQGKSFVGIAFHGQNDTSYEAVYFRPFNFKSPDKNNHSIQYISHPENPWFKLRELFPGLYESKIIPAPNPDQWFHVKIIITPRQIQVSVNKSNNYSFIIEKLLPKSAGLVGFWVGNGSDGTFRNLKIVQY